MKHKGVIVDVIPWAKVRPSSMRCVALCPPFYFAPCPHIFIFLARLTMQSRAFFFGRLRRKLALLSVQNHLLAANPTLSISQVFVSMQCAYCRLRAWCVAGCSRSRGRLTCGRTTWASPRGSPHSTPRSLPLAWLTQQDGANFKKDSVLHGLIEGVRAEHASDAVRQLLGSGSDLLSRCVLTRSFVTLCPTLFRPSFSISSS
jgi:hypothetical protein